MQPRPEYFRIAACKRFGRGCKPRPAANLLLQICRPYGAWSALPYIISRFFGGVRNLEI
ncbi:Uncharacterized protein dnm_001520 [Desulfonema magnum]|uniref:Uncharacterized protein n=1 Tax=Desulfonema magnum TaxID=45655 RepID=A0A975BFD5_9BACT|nr:Uncharacterized protein dnm_001520 [Desulfonema magnum]